LDTFFRQRNRPTRHPADVIDLIAVACRNTNVVLLHGAGPHLLELFELVRMHAHLTADLSFTMLRYQGSSLDQDIQFLCSRLDQRVTVGSDFPEYTPTEALQRFRAMTQNLPEEKRENILWRNLDRLFSEWHHHNRP
jgi:predicted TIM-barrel fold metal-dependent hydrolase